VSINAFAIKKMPRRAQSPTFNTGKAVLVEYSAKFARFTDSQLLQRLPSQYCPPAGTDVLFLACDLKELHK
jgi:hypothetical protein